MKKSKEGNNQHDKGYMLWLGDEHSLQTFLYAEEGILKHLSQGAKPEVGCCGTDEDVDEESSRLLNVADGVGVITVHGPLTNRDSWMNRFFGLVSYNEVRSALVQAVNDESVHEIMLDISSGGGPVAGVSDTADLIKTINKIKPITSFSDGSMFSAAYWLGSAAGTIKISNTAVVGSIGVIMRHIEYSKMMTEAGVTATMLRAGKYKALMNPYEPLSELAKDEADKQLTHLYQVFVQAVAENLGASYPDVDAKMAQGREFVGSMALEVSMVDGLTSFDQLMGSLIEKAKVSAGNDNTNLYMGSTTMKKKLLSASSYAAAAASGADMSEYSKVPEGAMSVAVEASNQAVVKAQENLDAVKGLDTSAKAAYATANEVIVAAGRTDVAATAVEIKAEADTKLAMESVATMLASSQKALDDSVAIQTEIAGTTDESVATAAAGKCDAVIIASDKALADAQSIKSGEAPDAPESGSLASVLQSQLETANQSVVNLKVELSQLKTANETLTTNMDAFSQIARDSINKMHVALGGSVSDLSALSGQALLMEHGKAADDFKAKFKVGPVAATEIDDLDLGGSKKSVPSAEHNAAVAAASSGK